jgi:hypothetical protein
MNEDLVSYIEQNRDIYTREAINKQLLDAGYQSVEIGAAWKEVDARHAPPAPASGAGDTGDIPAPPPAGWGDAAPVPAPQKPVVAMPAFWGVLAFFIAVSYVPLGILFYLASSNPDISSQLATVGMVLFGALQVAGLVGGAMVLRANRARGMGFLVGVVTVVVLLPCVALFVLLGTCLTYFSSI